MSRAAAGSLLVSVLLAACGGAPPRSPPPVEQARLLRSAGDEARAVGDPAGAARSYARALAAARAGDDRALAADLGYRLGLAYLGAGLPREAGEALDDAARTARGAGAPRLEARCLLALARARQDAGAGPAAVEATLGAARAVARDAGDRSAEALARVGLAALAEGDAARGHLDAAEALAAKDPAVAAPLALNRARRAERAGEPGAGRLFLAAAEAYRALEDAVGLYEGLAGAARAADRAPSSAGEAADLHRRAADAALRAGSPAEAAASLRRSAAAYARAGDAAEAARRTAEAERLEAGR